MNKINFNIVPQMFLYTSKEYDRVAFTEKIKGQWKDFSHSEILNKAIDLSIALKKLGLKPGDRIGLVSENRIEWIISDMAISFIGAVSVPVFPTLTTEQLKFIFNDCAAKSVIVSSKYQLEKIKTIKGNLQSLENIIHFDEIEGGSYNYIFDLIRKESEETNYDDKLIKLKNEFEKINENDLFTIIYTSGTTGNPKGVMLSHKNIISNIKNSIGTGSFYGYGSNLSYLPFCHAYERIAGYYVMFVLGSHIWIAESIEAISSNIKHAKPELMSTVPKLLDTVKHKIYTKISKESLIKQKIFYWAESVGKKKAKLRLNGKSKPINNIFYKVANKLVLQKIRTNLGGNLRIFVSGGAALSEDSADFFEMLGVSTIQGYGMTEASPVISVNTIFNNEIGTTGKPIQDTEVKIGDDGEILVKGPQIMMGYWNNEEETSKAIDDEGFLHTGDIGIITKKGNVKITDRKKNILVSSGGKNIAPTPVENALLESKFIEQVLLVGDGRDYCTALILPNIENLKILAEKLKLDSNELLSNPILIKEIRRDINERQKNFAKFEQARKFKFLPKPFSVETGELSPKMSIKRHFVEEKYQNLIEEMYG